MGFGVGSASEDSPPALDAPQLQAQAPDQPDRTVGQLDVLQVLRHLLHVLGLQHHGHQGPRPGQTPHEGLHRHADVLLAGLELQHLLDPEAETGGLREEGGDGVLGGGDEGHLLSPEVGPEVGQGPRLASEVGGGGEDVGALGEAQLAVEVGPHVDHGHVEGREGRAGGETGVRSSHGDQTWNITPVTFLQMSVRQCQPQSETEDRSS